MVFRVAKMVIFLLAVVITIPMTIASTRKTVFRWSENTHIIHPSPPGERTDKLRKAESASPDGETPKMYIYTLSEKSLRYRTAG